VKSDKEDHAQRVEIERVIVHPLYTKKYDYDVALVQLKQKLDLTSLNAPTPICLPRVGNYRTKYTGLNVTVAGNPLIVIIIIIFDKGLYLILSFRMG
jgi:hypothetical protein